MNPVEKSLAMILRLAAFILLVALIPVVMPFVWMKDIHQYLGMGQLPEGPIVGYLTRSLSAMCTRCTGRWSSSFPWTFGDTCR